jgi:hypothetical protein
MNGEQTDVSMRAHRLSFYYLTYSGCNRLSLTISMDHGNEHVARQLTTRYCRNWVLKPSRCNDRAMRRAPRLASSSLEATSRCEHGTAVLRPMFLLHTPCRSRYCYFTRWPDVGWAVWISNLHQHHLDGRSHGVLFPLPTPFRVNTYRLFTFVDHVSTFHCYFAQI